jgi:hypothetical protein
MTSKDLYYIAGLLEGEGCFGFYGCPSIQITMTDLDTVEKARMILDLKRVNKIRMQNKGSNRQDQYALNVSGDVAIQWMMTLYSLMSIRRKAKIREIISKWKGMTGLNFQQQDKGLAKARLITTLSRYKGISLEEAKIEINNSLIM